MTVDDERPGYERIESEAARLDRNYLEQLQELRVAQTGVQILFAFLLTIAFQQRFPAMGAVLRGLYVGTLVCATLAAGFFIAPVALHRVVFQRRLKRELVSFTGRTAVLGLVFLALTMLGSVLLIVDFVAGAGTAWAVTAPLGVGCVLWWYVVPMRLRTAAKPPRR